MKRFMVNADKTINKCKILKAEGKMSNIFSIFHKNHMGGGRKGKAPITAISSIFHICD